MPIKKDLCPYFLGERNSIGICSKLMNSPQGEDPTCSPKDREDYSNYHASDFIEGKLGIVWQKEGFTDVNKAKARLSRCPFVSIDAYSIRISSSS